MKTDELNGAALDWAVTKAEGFDHEVTSPEWGMWGWATDWAQGGPIIERENIGLWSEGYDWEAKIQTGAGEWLAEWGASPLIAAMRCYVASRLGADVDVPKGLA